MPITPHIEKHFLASALVRDIVIGMADGLTVPFALAAGLSGAVSSTSIIITAGLAEVAAGGLAMGLGGYLAARTDLEHYRSELQREKTEIKQVPESERAEVRQILRAQGLDPALAETVTAALTRDLERWINFMMRFELGLEEPEAGRELKSALTIGGAYVVGGLIPLSPYFFLPYKSTLWATATSPGTSSSTCPGKSSPSEQWIRIKQFLIDAVLCPERHHAQHW